MSLNTEESLRVFFKRCLEKAKQKQKLSLGAFTEHYLVSLLEKASDAETFFTTPNTEVRDEPLVLVFAKACETPSQTYQIELLKSIGDRALYMTGFFPDYFYHQGFDSSYYMSMGGAAYGMVSSLTEQKHDAPIKIFEELSQKFPHLVEVIAEISESAGMTSDQDLLKIYERWMQSKSQRLFEKLKSHGMFPVPSSKTQIH